MKKPIARVIPLPAPSGIEGRPKPKPSLTSVNSEALEIVHGIIEERSDMVKKSADLVVVGLNSEMDRAKSRVGNIAHKTDVLLSGAVDDVDKSQTIKNDPIEAAPGTQAAKTIRRSDLIIDAREGLKEVLSRTEPFNSDYLDMPA